MNVPAVPLGELADVVSGGTPKRSEPSFFGGDIPWVKIGDMLQGTVTGTEESITSAGLTGSSAKLLPAGTLLLSIFATIGRTAVLGIDAATNQAIAGLIIRDSSSVHHSYLRRYLEFASEGLAKQGRGVAQANINLSILRSHAVPMPSIEEQRRIAAVLDTAEALRAKRRLTLAKLDTLTHATFIDMFGDPVANPFGWRDDRVLADVADVRSGITKGRKTGSASLTPVPYLAVVNVQDGYIQLDPLKSIEATAAEIEKYALQTGDILLTEGGDPDKLGRGAVWHGQVEPCIHQNHVFRVRMVDDNMMPEFLSRLLASQRGKRYFLRMAKQTTGIASINMTQLRAFPLLEPPRATQDEFLSRISCVQAVEGSIKRSLVQLDALCAAIQQRAFRGEL